MWQFISTSCYDYFITDRMNISKNIVEIRNSFFWSILKKEIFSVLYSMKPQRLWCFRQSINISSCEFFIHGFSCWTYLMTSTVLVVHELSKTAMLFCAFKLNLYLKTNLRYVLQDITNWRVNSKYILIKLRINKDKY